MHLQICFGESIYEKADGSLVNFPFNIMVLGYYSSPFSATVPFVSCSGVSCWSIIIIIR
jgi:hypothetical protein